ncbi:MAG: prolyl oligopeptidase family serine peptidase [Gemmatimonadota bacterium]|nr:prolyl oligopeptidase family serine peptidase [Gemmatimonadota bacterium]
MAIAPLASAQKSAPLKYPSSRASKHVDNYHGTKVPDPFRWLEDDTASAVKAWVGDQNAVTFGYLDRIAYRAPLLSRLKELSNYPRTSMPMRRMGWVWYTKNSGLQNQSVYYIQRGLEGTPDVLIDPNTLTADGTTRVGGFQLDESGTRLAYTMSRAGSDWQEIHVMDPLTRRDFSDVVRWVKVSGIAWQGSGFYYSRYPTPADTTKALSGVNENHQVFYHALGTDQSKDRLIYADPANPQRFHTAATTDDQRFLLLTISDRGKGLDGNALWVRDLTSADTAWRKVVPGFGKEFDVIDNDGRFLLVLTNAGAPNRRVVRIDPEAPAESNWKVIIPEQPETLEGVSNVGGRLFASYLKDVVSKIVQYRYDGTRERDVTLPGVGTAGFASGERTDGETFFSFTSFTAPPTTYRYDIARGTSTVYLQPKLPFDPSQFETRQAFATSKDGTKIPMFIVAKKGLVLDGRNPTLVYGYGGFNISLTPGFSASRVAWLEQGGVFVQVNMRGGGEYGEAWHQAGMKGNKQNVFDDFIAAGEWLVANKYTSKDRMAMQGGSNGGLLVGAVMAQRPDLFRVALPAVGVMDMLRFQKFTIGWNWIADYGSSDNAEDFAYLIKYSPLQNLKNGTAYPATMVTTADHDDRVVPAHSFKFAARLQQAHKGPNPVLIRVATSSGHGSSSLTKGLEETADLFAFTMHNLGMSPTFPPKPAVVP